MLSLYIDKTIFSVVFFFSFYYRQISKKIFFYSIYHVLKQYLFTFNKYHCYYLYLYSLLRTSNLLENCSQNKMINNFPMNNTPYIWNINLISVTSMQIIILVLLLRKAFSQLVFIFASKMDKKDLIISLLLSFRLSRRKVCKYILKTILFSMLSIKIIVFSMLLMPSIFNNIRNLRFSKPELMIRIIV